MAILCRYLQLRNESPPRICSVVSTWGEYTRTIQYHSTPQMETPIVALVREDMFHTAFCSKNKDDWEEKQDAQKAMERW